MDRELSVTTAEIMEELVGRYCLQPAPPGSFTVREFVEKTGTGRSTAERILKTEVAAGRLQMRYCLVQGKRSAVYWKE